MLTALRSAGVTILMPTMVSDRIDAATLVSMALWLAIVFVAVQAWRLRRKRVTIGPAAGAMMHEILSDDRRKAIETVVEERAAYRDPEDAEGAPNARSRN